MNPVRGTVINIHHHGATVRLEDGTLAAVPADELAAHRTAYVSGHASRTPLALLVERQGRHSIVALETPGDAARPAGATPVPRLIDAAFEAQMNAFLKSTAPQWPASDGPPAAERHFIRKKRRAALFEARTRTT